MAEAAISHLRYTQSKMQRNSAYNKYTTAAEPDWALPGDDADDGSDWSMMRGLVMKSLSALD